MRGVGYIVGNTLGIIQDQWVELLDANVDVILFDRACLKTCASVDFKQFSKEQEAIWQCMESMRAGQAISGNFDNYETLEDLAPGDTIVLVGLNVLEFASWYIWERIYRRHTQGVFVASLSDGFHSKGEYGDNMLNMMNNIYEFAKKNQAQIS